MARRWFSSGCTGLNPSKGKEPLRPRGGQRRGRGADSVLIPQRVRSLFGRSPACRGYCKPSSLNPSKGKEPLRPFRDVRAGLGSCFGLNPSKGKEPLRPPQMSVSAELWVVGLNPSKGKEPLRPNRQYALSRLTPRVLIPQRVRSLFGPNLRSSSRILVMVLIPQRVRSLFGPSLSTAPLFALNRFRSLHFALFQVDETGFPRVCHDHLISTLF